VEIEETFREQLDSLHSISVEIASLHELPQVYNTALKYCLGLTGSQLGFIGLLSQKREYLDLVAVIGFEPTDPSFFDRYRVMPVRRSVFGVTIVDERPHVSNDVEHDPERVGTPRGHPEVRTFLGVPLQVGETVIGMIGAGNRSGGYGPDEQRCLSTFANHVAIAIDNARLYERQREMIASLEDLQRRLALADAESLLAQDRARIASGLHERVGQALFGLGLKINSLLERELDLELAESVRELRRMVADTLDDLRQVIFALSHPPGAKRGVTEAIGSLLRDVGRDNGLDVDLVTRGVPPAGIEAVHDVLLTVAREALNNVVRHAQARTVLISIRYELERVQMVVQDDGVGMPSPDLDAGGDGTTHFGLSEMRRRILDVGGTFEVERGDEGGVRIRIDVPVQRKET
jgi:signal transduction histidine kinase